MICDTQDHERLVQEWLCHILLRSAEEGGVGDTVLADPLPARDGGGAGAGSEAGQVWREKIEEERRGVLQAWAARLKPVASK